MKKIFLLFLIVTCLFMTSCTKKEKHILSKKQIIEILEKDNTSSKKLVKDVYFASDTYTVNDLQMSFDDETIKLGDYENYIQGEHNKLIIGYYDEEGLTYYLYRLSTNNDGTTKIWELAKNKDDSFDNVGWIATFVENPLDLIMVEFNEVPNVNDGDYHRFGIYTIVGKELVKVR